MVLMLFTWGLTERRSQVSEQEVGFYVAETNYIQCRRGKSARISIFGTKLAQEIKSGQNECHLLTPLLNIGEAPS